MFNQSTQTDSIQYQVPPIDEWTPEPEDIIFRTIKGYIVAPISSIWNISENGVDLFSIAAKKCYNSDDMRSHICQYLNYFEKYYDRDRELFSLIANIKWLITYRQEYRKENFLYDLRRYILSPSIVGKVMRMVEDNYTLSLTYKNINNPPLQYTDDHAKYFMIMSVLMCFSIPICTHFAYVKRVTDIDEFLLECYEGIIYLFEDKVDIYAKLRETSYTNIAKNESNNRVIWESQSIRGKDTVTHSVDSVENILLNLIPKYRFDKNMVAMNWTSIRKNTMFKITDIGFEFTYIPLSSLRKDEDSTSDYDKFESTLVKQSETLYLQNKVNCATTLNTLESMFGSFDEEEIKFYMKELRDSNGSCLNSFQQQLIFNIFYKYFGDTISAYAINIKEYVKLMITARRILQSQNMVILPYIISSKIEKLVGRKSVNKKEMMRIEASKYYPMVMDKYQNEKIIKQILSTIATIITSDFRIIDFHDPSIHGMQIVVSPEMIIEEYLAYTLLV